MDDVHLPGLANMIQGETVRLRRKEMRRFLVLYNDEFYDHRVGVRRPRAPRTAPPQNVSGQDDDAPPQNVTGQDDDDDEEPAEEEEENNQDENAGNEQNQDLNAGGNEEQNQDPNAGPVPPRWQLRSRSIYLQPPHLPAPTEIPGTSQTAPLSHIAEVITETTTEPPAHPEVTTTEPQGLGVTTKTATEPQAHPEVTTEPQELGETIETTTEHQAHPEVTTTEPLAHPEVTTTEFQGVGAQGLGLTTETTTEPQGARAGASWAQQSERSKRVRAKKNLILTRKMKTALHMKAFYHVLMDVLPTKDSPLSLDNLQKRLQKFLARYGGSPSNFNINIACQVFKNYFLLLPESQSQYEIAFKIGNGVCYFEAKGVHAKGDEWTELEEERAEPGLEDEMAELE